MSEIEEKLARAEDCLDVRGLDEQYLTLSFIEAIANSLYVIARAVVDLDEVEEMYKDYPADSDWERWRDNE